MVDVSGTGPRHDEAISGTWVVLVADPVTGETDAFGPFDRQAAARDAKRRRDEHVSEGLDEVVVVPVPLTLPEE